MRIDQKNKCVTAIFASVFALSLCASVVAEAQSRSARGVDMRSLQNQDADPCKSFGKIYVPTHPNADSEGCVNVLALSPSASGALFVDGSATFEDKTTFNQGVVLGQPSACNAANEGALRYNRSTKKVQFCDGSQWQNLEQIITVTKTVIKEVPSTPTATPAPTPSPAPTPAPEPSPQPIPDPGPEKTVGNWTVTNLGQCSQTCGGGTQERSVVCKYDECSGTKPPTKIMCNTQACPTNQPTPTSGPWTVGAWGAPNPANICWRSVKCNFDSCTGPKPATSKSCKPTTTTGPWTVGAWGAPNAANVCWRSVKCNFDKCTGSKPATSKSCPVAKPTPQPAPAPKPDCMKQADHGCVKGAAVRVGPDDAVIWVESEQDARRRFGKGK